MSEQGMSEGAEVRPPLTREAVIAEIKQAKKTEGSGWSNNFPHKIQGAPERKTIDTSDTKEISNRQRLEESYKRIGKVGNLSIYSDFFLDQTQGDYLRAIDQAFESQRLTGQAQYLQKVINESTDPQEVDDAIEQLREIATEPYIELRLKGYKPYDLSY